jgi:hypothetical protein
MQIAIGDDLSVRYADTMLLTSGYCVDGSIMYADLLRPCFRGPCESRLLVASERPYDCICGRYADVNGDLLQDQFCYTKNGDLWVKLSVRHPMGPATHPGYSLCHRTARSRHGGWFICGPLG